MNQKTLKLSKFCGRLRKDDAFAVSCQYVDGLRFIVWKRGTEDCYEGRSSLYIFFNERVGRSSRLFFQNILAGFLKSYSKARVVKIIFYLFMPF